MRPDIVPGATFPDYSLPDHTNTVRTLSELQGGDPLILTLARGHYCPKEHQQHLELAANYPKIAVSYTQVATISPDDHHSPQEFSGALGAPGLVRRSPASGPTCALCRARSAPTGTSASRAYARPGRQAITRTSTDGTNG